MKTSHKLSNTRVAWIREQGYFSYTDAEIRELAFGNRFAYRLCTIIMLTGVAMANVPLLLAMNLVAFASVLLPNHPFDYIYNGLIRRWINGPRLPHRTVQLKFACSMATVFLGTTNYFFITGQMIPGYITGTTLGVVATMVAGIDLCLPSKIWNAMMGIKVPAKA